MIEDAEQQDESIALARKCELTVDVHVVDLHAGAEMVAQCSGATQAVHVRGRRVENVDLPAVEILKRKCQVTVSCSDIGHGQTLGESSYVPVLATKHRVDMHEIGEDVVRVPGKVVVDLLARGAQALDLAAEALNELIDVHGRRSQ